MRELIRDARYSVERAVGSLLMVMAGRDAAREVCSWRAFGVALLATVGGLATRLALDPLLQRGEAPYTCFVPAVFLAGLLYGHRCAIWTGLMGLVLGLVLIDNDHEVALAIPYLITIGLVTFLVHLVTRTIPGLRDDLSREQLYQRELRHRIKNNLAVVQALARQSARGAKDMKAFQRDFGERLHALAVAHDLMGEQSWDGADVRRTVEAALFPFGLDRFDLGGPDVCVRPERGISLGLCLHELCTNAVKYGSLSRVKGRVSVTWRLVDRRHVEVCWVEHGGPRVHVPERTGLGTVLLRAGIGPSSIEYKQDGLCWTTTTEVQGNSAAI